MQNLYVFGRQRALKFNHLQIASHIKTARLIKNIGYATRHSSCKISARLAKHDVESLSRATEEAVAKQKGVVETLRKEWGAQTDERVKKADAVLTAILGDAWAQHFAFDKHPEVIKAFYELSTRLSEDTLRLPGATQTGGPRTGPDGNPVLSYPNTPSMNR